MRMSLPKVVLPSVKFFPPWNLISGFLIMFSYSYLIQFPLNKKKEKRKKTMSK